MRFLGPPKTRLTAGSPHTDVEEEPRDTSSQSLRQPLLHSLCRNSRVRTSAARLSGQLCASQAHSAQGASAALAEVQGPLGPASEEPTAPPAPSPCPEQRMGPHQAWGTGSQTQAGRTGQQGAELIPSTQWRPPPAVVLSASTITPCPRLVSQ